MADSAQAYRQTNSMFVCSPTNHMNDVATLEAFVKKYKELNGKVPPQVESALQIARSGRNVEESLNVACDGLFKFYMAEETRCAREAGFKSLEDMYANRASQSDAVAVYDVCIAQVIHRWPLTNIDYTLNLANPDSAARQFLERSRKQVMEIISKYVKKTVLQKVKGNPPPYERMP